MILNVRLFARARDVAGAEQVQVELGDDAVVRDLREALGTQYPPLKPFVPSLLIAIGTDYASDLQPLQAGHDIACFPPVSGG